MSELKKTCIVGIASSNPYDSSVFVDSEDLVYKTISYAELLNLYNIIKSYTNANDDSIDVNITNTTNINLIYIFECFKNSHIEMIFRFLCSSDCVEGKMFINENTTKIINQFVKLISMRKCVVEFSDHSLGSFFSNWDDELMEMKKPIEILDFTHSGEFKMRGCKLDFVNSSHPTLRQIGNLSLESDIEITFNNMSGTKVYKLLTDDVKIISIGNQINTLSKRNIFNFNCNDTYNKNSNVYMSVPVHSEFEYNMAIIVLSSTHWCNLNSVETSVDIPTLRRYCTESMGSAETQKLDYMLSTTTDKVELKRVISSCVRGISSGSKTIC